jgi:glycosyltransferase involved in cell wall biosynthesis
MKIAIVRTHMQQGGVEIILQHLAIELKKAKHDIDIYVWNDANNDMSQSLLKEGIPIYVGLPSNFNNYEAIICWAPMLYKSQLDKYNNKLYCIVGNKSPGYFSKEIDQLFNVTGCICDSQNSIDFVHEANPNMDCYRWFHMKEPSLLNVKRDLHKFRLPENKVIFGTMCNLSKKKLVNRTIDCFAEAIRRGAKNIHLAIAGDGPLTNQLQAQAIACCPKGTVTFVGRQAQNNTGFFLNCLDCFLTSIAPGQGGICMSANESTGAGCFLIIGDVAGIKENILHPDFGICIPNQDLEQRMPEEILKFSRRSRADLDIIKSRIKDAYKELYSNHGGIVEWLTQ